MRRTHVRKMRKEIARRTRTDIDARLRCWVQQMAGTAGARRSCCGGHRRTRRSRAFQSCTHGRRRSAVMAKISDDRTSGERRRARLEWRTPGRERACCNEIGVLHRPRCERLRQLRRLRQQRSRGEMNRGADRAVIVRVTDGLLGLLGRRRRAGRRSCDSKAAAAMLEVAEVDVAEREDDLQRQREQRQARANPQPRPHPSHH